MNQISLLKKLIIILLWGIISYVSSTFIVDVEIIQKGLFILLICIGLWITEIIPLPATALLVPVMAYLSGILEPKAAMAPFSSTIIFLFMGGFTLAALLNKYGIDHWLAHFVINLGKGRLWVSTTGFFAVVTTLSMWMSNTATTAMMLPISLALVDRQFPRMRTFIVLGTAYAANIGGLATVTGSPPNGIAVAALDLDWFTWFKVGFPTALIMFPFIIIALRLVIQPEANAKLNHLQISEKKMDWNSGAKCSVGIFLFTVVCWIFSSQFNQWLGVVQFDRMIAILITALAPALGLISWKELEDRIQWGILLLFGGGLCISAVLTKTGTTKWIATSILGSIAGAPEWLVILVCIGFMIFLTELASNTGSAAILIPLMISLSHEFNPLMTYPLVFGIGIAATCAFMLPVATPPNALVYGTGYIKQKQMLRAGFILNIFAIIVVFTSVSLFA